MKRIILMISSSLLAMTTFAQKPLIDTAMYHEFHRGVEIGYLSNDGKYMSYRFSDTDGKGHWLVEATDHRWKKQVEGVVQAFFANNDQLIIYKKGKDSLCLQRLGKSDITYIKNVSSFQISNAGQAGNLLAYQLNTPQKGLVLRNLSTQKERSFSAVTAYQFNDKGTVMLFQQQISDSTINLQWLDLASGSETMIWQGAKIGQPIFSADGKQIAFVGENTSGQRSILQYKGSDPKASKLFEENPRETGKDLKIGEVINFNSTADRLFFTLQQTISRPKPDPKLASVDVYSYKDGKLQSQQLFEVQHNTGHTSTYVYNFSSQKIIQLVKGNEEPIEGTNNRQKQDFVLVKKNRGGNETEWNWNPASLYSVYLVSTTDGSEKCIATNKPSPLADDYQLSPNDKYVLNYDPVQKNYCSYNIATGITKNITKGVKTTWRNELSQDWPDSTYEISNPYCRWSANDKTVLIQSTNDIIQADACGKKPAISLTGYYGEKHHLVFQSVPANTDNTATKIVPNQTLLYHVVNEDDKDEGFCKIKVGSSNGFELMKVQPFHIEQIQKARDAEVYTALLSNAENAPNLFLTKDLRSWEQITNIQPQKAYNWLTAKLITWKVPGGKTIQGILYKPENFDPKKKYPVIFFYYERKSQGLHDFPGLGYSDGGSINIPTYVSNGYLVFVPDIYYKVGYPGKSAFNTIISAADYISKFAWVDQRHMGLMGHSFGGFETNYVITHSHRFAAAVSMSGMSDFISAYGSIVGGGVSRQRQYELYRDRMGTTPWQRPDLYLENSPVLRADKVTTPVLIMANLKDDDVPSQQGFELFTALRRLQKKAWLLQYDKGEHMVYDAGGGELERKDVSTRTRQFFDYYLKSNTLPPKWMVQGIPAKDKQIDSGFELDTIGKQP